jgi:hypothetical protein
MRGGRIDSEPRLTWRVSARLRCIPVTPMTSSAISSRDDQCSSAVRSPSDRRRNARAAGSPAA